MVSLVTLFSRTYSGTTELTIVDFWRMVWQQRCGKIVMLTVLDEGDTVGKLIKIICYF